MIQRYWVSWWTRYLAKDGCTAPPFQIWETGLRCRNGEGDFNDSSMIAVIEAGSTEIIESVIAHHFPDYEMRFCDPVEPGWKPNDRFPDFDEQHIGRYPTPPAQPDAVAALVAACEPFAETANNFGIIDKAGELSYYDYHVKGLNLTYDDFRKLAAALAAVKGKVDND